MTENSQVAEQLSGRDVYRRHCENAVSRYVQKSELMTVFPLLPEDQDYILETGLRYPRKDMFAFSSIFERFEARFPDIAAGERNLKILWACWNTMCESSHLILLVPEDTKVAGNYRELFGHVPMPVLRKVEGEWWLIHSEWKIDGLRRHFWKLKTVEDGMKIGWEIIREKKKVLPKGRLTVPRWIDVFGSMMKTSFE